MKRIIPLLLFSISMVCPVLAQDQVRGIVKDMEGSPVPGATVQEKGTGNYTVTDTDGVFSLIPDQQLPVTILISAVGLKVQEIEIYEIIPEQLEFNLKMDNVLNEVTVTARRRNESVQKIPIPVSVVRGDFIQKTGAFNVNRVKELVPSVQLYSSNPRNTTLNIRGLGSTFGLTNDGIDPGVGFYVDGVYNARPAATSLDFIDIEQIEVLRGPQGTLFGKNTTAGAFNITTRKPGFTTAVDFELSYGNYGYIQAKSSVTGPILRDKLAGRFSFSGTQRDGTVYNTVKDEYVNDLNNIGFRGQFLFVPHRNVEIILTGDASSQKPNGYAQVVAGVVTTKRQDFRQFSNIIADLNYTLPTKNPFDRIIDHDTPWRSLNQLGGVSLNADIKTGQGILTSTTAWRYWNWGPSNDRDFTSLPVLNLSQAPSRHDQWSQEIRFSGNFSSKLSGVIGAFILGQNLSSDPYHTEESGSAQWRFVQNTQDTLWETPGLLDGYGIHTTSSLQSFSGAVFANADWAVTNKFHILPGLRFNYDTKDVDYNRGTYGGLDTEDPDLLALKNKVYSPQEFTTSVKNNNLSGQITLNYLFSANVNAFLTWSSSYKPIGVNLGGLPSVNGQPMLELAEVKPEFVSHMELGVKTSPFNNATINLTFHHTTIDDYQTLVQTPELGVNRGYLSNAEEVRVYGAEMDGNIHIHDNLSFYGALSFTSGEYVSFTNAPVPLEEVGGEQAFKDISGGRLPGISRWVGSFGGELATHELKLLTIPGKIFLGLDAFFRSGFSSSPSPSKYLNVEGYAVLNARVGFREEKGLSYFFWVRNLLNQEYFEQLLVASGSAGHYAGVLGDPATFGITLKYTF